MKQLIFSALLILAAIQIGHGQVPQQTPLPTPPDSVEIIVRVDGVETTYDLRPAAIGVLNKLMHAQKHEGTFGERFVFLVKNIVRELAGRDELNTEAKAERDAANARIKAAAEAAATERKR